MKTAKKGLVEGHLLITLPEEYIQQLNKVSIKVQRHIRSKVVQEFFEWGFERFYKERFGQEAPGKVEDSHS